MFCSGRPADQDFSDPSEALYRRCSESDVDLANDRALVSAFSFPTPPRLSLNRGRHSEPGDCRYPSRHQDYVVAIPVETVPPFLETENGGKTCHFKLVHDPIRKDDPERGEFENYGHTELRVYKQPSCEPEHEYPKGSALPNTTKIKFRQKLADNSRIVLEPNAAMSQGGQ